MSLETSAARGIVTALRQGVVPSVGLDHFAVGIEPPRAAIGEELDDVALGRGNLKFIRGGYGAGKTFLANLALADAQAKGFVTARCAISAQVPLSRLEAIYAALMAGLSVRGQHEALRGLLDRWIFRIEESLLEERGLDEDDPALRQAVETRLRHDLLQIVALPAAFSQAVLAYYHATREADLSSAHGEAWEQANGVLGWLAGQRGVGAAIKRRANLTGQLNEQLVPGFLRGVAAVAVAAGAKGLVVVLDELETIQRLTRPQREAALNNLRQLVDDVQSGNYPYLYVLGTGTEDFFEGSRGVPALEPLYDRIKLVGERQFSNPRQIQIVLQPFDRDRLIEVAARVRAIYRTAWPEQPLDPERTSDAVIAAVADKVTSKLGGRIDVVPRLFLREWVDILDRVQQHPDYDPRQRYDFAAADLTPEEEEAARGGAGDFREAPVI